MNNTRLQLLPQNQLVSTVTDLKQSVAAAKSTQYLGGSSILSYVTSTGSAYDWSGTLTQNPYGPTGQGAAWLLVSATAQTMQVLYAQFQLKMYVGSPTSWYRPTDYYNDLTAGKQGFITNVIDAPNSVSNDALVQCIVSVYGDLTRTVYLQFFVQALDTVIIGVETIV